MRSVRQRYAQVVALGTDYLTAGAGTSFTFPGIDVVQFKGNPITGLGTTDTVVERQEDADLAPAGSATIPIQVMQLSLESIAPVTIGGNACNLFVVLDPANLKKDVGAMTILGAPPYTSGSFDSTFTLYLRGHIPKRDDRSDVHSASKGELPVRAKQRGVAVQSPPVPVSENRQGQLHPHDPAHE